MPIYKVDKIKNNEGLQKYRVRVNYNDELGHKKQLTRVAYGIDSAKDMERRLEFQIKTEHEMPVKKMTVQELFNDYIETKKFEVRETTLDKSKRIINYYILPILKDVYIDKLTVMVLKKWKLSMEKRNLSVVTKNNVYTELRAMLNYAVRMEYIQKHQLNKVGNFKDVLSRKKEMNFYTPEEFKKFIKQEHKKRQQIRHSHASLLVNMGINIQQVAKRLGHTRVEITWNTYSHLYPREEERAIEILNAV